MPAYAALWGNKVNTQDLQRIITELRIYDDPDLPYYNEIFRLYYHDSKELLNALNNKIEITQQAIKILDTDIKKDELGNLTYGRYLLNAINEEELVEMAIKTGSSGQANGEYFSKLGENLADWKSQLNKFLITKIIGATCTAMGVPVLSIGISTLGLSCDLSIIGISINKLKEVWYEKAFWSYMQFRNDHNFDHYDAWKGYAETQVKYILNLSLLSLEKQEKAKEAIEENFRALWDKYGDHIVSNKLDEDFKSQQRESLKMLILYALGSEPHPIITSPLKITPPSPYQVGDIINAEFTIANQGTLPIKFSVLTVGGRDNDNQVADFSHRQNIILKPIESYDYKGTLTLNKVGNYHFFCTYQTPDDEWNTNVDVGSKLTDEDREEDIYVKEKEDQYTVPEISNKINIEWEKTFGGCGLNIAYSIIQTKDGGYIVTGIKKGKYPWVFKLDERGKIEWEKTFGEKKDEWAYSLVKTGDRSLAILSSKRVNRGNYSLLAKINEKGNIKWDEVPLHGINPRADFIIQTKDGGWVLSKALYHDGVNISKIKDIREGDKIYKAICQWINTYGKGEVEVPYCIIQTKDEGYAIAGEIRGDIWISKIDERGNVEWDKTYRASGNSYNRPFSIIQTKDGGYAIAGFVDIAKSARRFDIFALKLDEKGKLRWAKTFDRTVNDWANSIIQTKDGGYAIAGRIEGSKNPNITGISSAWVLKLDEKGRLEGDKIFGEKQSDAYSIIDTKDGGYAIAGCVYVRDKGTTNIETDAWVVKFK